ncbi:hypothetical protein V8E36_000562 [Tilletia maclaganii]
MPRAARAHRRPSVRSTSTLPTTKQPRPRLAASSSRPSSAPVAARTSRSLSRSTSRRSGASSRFPIRFTPSQSASLIRKALSVALAGSPMAEDRHGPEPAGASRSPRAHKGGGSGSNGCSRLAVVFVRSRGLALDFPYTSALYSCGSNAPSRFHKEIVSFRIVTQIPLPTSAARSFSCERLASSFRAFYSQTLAIYPPISSPFVL